jgi:hypothetical protein
VRFVLTPNNARGPLVGRLMGFIDGQWVPVTLMDYGGGIVPAH